MSSDAWCYVSDVAEDGVTAERELRVLQSIALRQRVLRGFRRSDTTSCLLGLELSAPIVAAPTSSQGLAHDDGEVATVRGCAAAGTFAIVSSRASRRIEDIGAERLPWWLQAYPQPDLDLTRELIATAVGHGARAVVLTVDVPVLGRRRDLPTGYVPPGWRDPDAPLVGVRADQNLRAMAQDPFTWDQVAELKAEVAVPLLLKGVLDHEDAALAAEAGLDGIVVSTHGGRQLDGTVTAAEALPAIVQSVAGRCLVLADGSVRRGSHVLRLLARGADAVLVGRPIVWGLACGGDAGVRDVIEILKAELATAMALTGCRDVASVTRDIEWRERD
jgi:4-hydroxymandelate oxidase